MRSSTTSTEDHSNASESRRFCFFCALAGNDACLWVAAASSDTFVIALGDNIRTIDPIGSPSVDAASERVRALMFNSLVKKNEKFDYVGELADVQRSDDGLTFTFTLQDGVKFHDGRPLTSADAKYTLDLVFSSNFAKSASFFEGSGEKRKVTSPASKRLMRKRWWLR